MIALQKQIDAKHPKTGKPVTIIGVDTNEIFPRLVVLHRGPRGIFAEVVENADEIPQ